MKLQLSDTFSCDPDTLFDILVGDELQALITALSSSKREVYPMCWEGEHQVLSSRVQPSRELPGLIKKALGPAGLSYFHTNRYHRPSMSNEWKIEVERANGRVQIGGRSEIIPTETGCIRHMSAVISVNIPLLGWKLENGIAADIRRTYERSTALILRVLSAG